MLHRIVLLGDDATPHFASPSPLGQHSTTVGHICLAWHVQRGLSLVPKSVTASRIAANIDVFDIELDADDMAVSPAPRRPRSRKPDCGLDAWYCTADEIQIYHPCQYLYMFQLSILHTRAAIATAISRCHTSRPHV